MAHPSPELVQPVLDHSPTGILVTDIQGTLSWENATLQRLLGTRAAQLEAQQFEALVSDLSVLEITAEQGEITHLEHRWVQTPDAAYVIHYYSDCTARVRAETRAASLEEQVQKLSLKDSETGVMNQRGLMLLLEPQVSLSRRYENPLSVLALSADTEAGDGSGMLSVSRLLREQLRWADLLGRDEAGNFVVILPETGRDAALSLSEKVAERLAHQHGIGNVCAGVTEWNRVDDAASLLSRAREALAEAHNRQDTGIVAA